MTRILWHVGQASLCGLLLYFWLVWMFAPEGPVHHAYAVTQIDEVKQQIDEDLQAVSRLNPLPHLLSFEPTEGVFDDVEDSSAEGSRQESDASGSEPESEAGRITTFDPVVRKSGDRSN